MTGDRLTIYHIRYYHQHLRPEKFGWAVRLLNQIRWRLELWVQRLALAQLHRMTREELPLDVFQAQFTRDVEAEREAYQTGVLPKSKRAVFPERLGDPTGDTTVIVAPKAAEKISSGSVLTEPPKPADALFAKYAFGIKRIQDGPVVVDDFEAIPPTKPRPTREALARESQRQVSGPIPVPKDQIVGKFEFSTKKKKEN